MKPKNFEAIKAVIAKHFPSGEISVAELRKALVETGLAAELEQWKTPPSEAKPELPPHAPRDWLEAAFCPGICAIPLWSENRWRYFVFNAGCAVVDGRTGRWVGFDTYEEAMREGEAWQAWLRKN